MSRGETAAIVDIDGTLVDSNYQHALAWFRAFRGHGVTCEVWRLHRLIGMGGDQLVEAAAGAEVERALGDEIRDAEASAFAEMIDEVTALALLTGGYGRDELREAGAVAVHASLAEAVEHLGEYGLLGEGRA